MAQMTVAVALGAEAPDHWSHHLKDTLEAGRGLCDERLARLSAQEERILTLVAEGRTNREIGDQLKLAEKTVKNYLSSIMSKLEVARRAEAAAYLARHTQNEG